MPQPMLFVPRIRNRTKTEGRQAESDEFYLPQVCPLFRETW